MTRCPTCLRPFLREPASIEPAMSEYHERCAGCAYPTAKSLLFEGKCEHCRKSPVKRGFVMKLRKVAIALCLLLLPALAQAQTPITTNCMLSWSPNQETDLAGYKAWASKGGVKNQIVVIQKPTTQTSCAALGVTTEGTWDFSVSAFDTANQESTPSTVVGVINPPPAPPGGLQLSSQPIAMSVTPNPSAKTATVSWIPGTCTKEFVVTRLVSGKWVEVGRTARNWYEAPLVDQVNQPYGVSAVCS